MQVSADANAGANANAGHSSTIEQSSLDDHHGASQNIIEEEKATYGVKQSDRDIGANMETHGKALQDRLDEASGKTQKGPKKDHLIGDEGDAHDLAHRRQP